MTPQQTTCFDHHLCLIRWAWPWLHMSCCCRYCPGCRNDTSEVVLAGEKLKESKKKSKMASASSSSQRDWGKVRTDFTCSVPFYTTSHYIIFVIKHQSLNLQTLLTPPSPGNGLCWSNQAVHYRPVQPPRPNPWHPCWLLVEVQSSGQSMQRAKMVLVFNFRLTWI